MLDHRSSMDTATRPAATRAGARRACPLRPERPSPIQTARLEGEARQLLMLLSSSMFVTSWMIVSFSPGLLIAVMSVIAANAFEEPIFSPLSRGNALLMLR